MAIFKFNPSCFMKMKSLYYYGLTWMASNVAFASGTPPAEAPVAVASPAVEAPETIITSDTLDLLSEGQNQRFIFKGHVAVQDAQWSLKCDELEVHSVNPPKDANDAPKGSAQKIFAKGNVHIQQGLREAKAGLAEIFPDEGKIVLKDNPSLTHSEGKVEGYQITIFTQNQSDGSPGKVIVEGNPNAPTERPKVILPAFNTPGTKSIETPAQQEAPTSPLK
jgi:lipopolysaccharide export system protein LptA